MQKEEDDHERGDRVRQDHHGERGKTPAPERGTGQPYATEVEDYSHPDAPGHPSADAGGVSDINSRPRARSGNE